MAHSDAELDTLAIHAGQSPDPTSGAVMTPIVLSSTFAQEGPGKHKGFEYARTDNPTRRTLEHCLAALEAAKYGLAFASGCAAMTTLLHERGAAEGADEIAAAVGVVDLHGEAGSAETGERR